MKVCYVVPSASSSKASCKMKTEVESQDRDFLKRKLLIASKEHSTKNTLPSERSKAEICSKLLGFNYKL